MAGKTISEKILSATSGVDARAGDVVVCTFDYALGTDGSTPMAIDYFNEMGGDRVLHPERIAFSLDHYSPPNSAKSAGLHDRIRQFARDQGIRTFEVGEGIGLQLMVETGWCRPGGLVVGADSHSVTFGAMNTFGTGIGSSDLAAAMISGQVWLRVPETTKVLLEGGLPEGVYPKDIALALVGKLGQEGANYQTLEFHGPAAQALTIDDRLVVSNLVVEMGAKAGIFMADARTEAYLRGRTDATYAPVDPDADARYLREVVIDVSQLVPQVARPHEPDDVVPLSVAAGTPVDMVFIGTCTGGRTRDFHEALEILMQGGGIAPGVMLVVTPASREVLLELTLDGSLERFTRMGAVLTTPGCGACCGTSGVIPGDGMTVISTANRNFKARMGNATAQIYLASPASCAAAAVTGRITDPRRSA
ncbi:MAG: 3-isopropylmalate dehydratase [Gemmatimonadetes bacterium]|nr:3-isopropylmalate dehydratase [Gemmatimonadota bacterium]